LKERFREAQPGDYIVTAQENSYSLLIVRSVSDRLLLEEISVPEKQIDLKSVNWHEWLMRRAPGHTTWTFYTLDLKEGRLLDCFSYSKKEWVCLENQEQFLARLLQLELQPTPDKERKRIGPKGSEETDQRKLWNPALICEGKKSERAVFTVMHTQWPEDGSPLSDCRVELYFDHARPTFPFPYWIEVKSPHYAYKVRAIDSGHHLTSPLKKTTYQQPTLSGKNGASP
jgi:hypothetical protein